MFLHIDDIKKIQQILNNFPDAEMFELKQIGDNGIGSETILRINTKLNDMDCAMEFVVSGIENW